MIEIEETDSGLDVADAGKNELAIRSPDWHPDGSPRSIPYYVDESIAGRASELRFPESAVNVESTTRNRWVVLGNELGSRRLERDDFVIKVNAEITAYVRFNAPVTVRRLVSTKEVVLRFPENTAVTIGLRSRTRRPSHCITVPPTTDGVATALSYLSAALETTTPDRSYPSLRRHPPSIELGESVDVPADVRSERSETGIELRVPDSFDSLFVVAPLAYYLQASVVSENRTVPRLEAPAVDLAYDFQSLPGFQCDVADMLRRVFSLDCLVRNAGRYQTDLAELSLLEGFPLDAKGTYDASPGERLATYLDAPFERIEADLPDWHLSMYVDPVVEHVTTLPWHLDRLSLIQLPDASPLPRDEFVERSVNSFYRSSAPSRGGSDVEPLLPDLREARMHGWLADGVPIDVFKAIPQSYEHRLDYLDQGGRSKLVRVVLNDPDMEHEQVSVAEIYEKRAEELSIEVEIERGIGRDALIEVFQNPADFVHYIGHCTEDGLQCTDGYLSAADLDECNTQTFFLNACGSYTEGVELVRKGSVAGAVTLEDVLDRQATRVGTAFAQLIMHGFSMERALRIARRQSITGKGYVVVGDGTHALSQGDDKHPLVLQVNSQSSERFHVTAEAFSSDNTGGVYQSYIPKDNAKHLFGNSVFLEVSKGILLEHLFQANTPTIYNDRYYWSDDLYAELAQD